MKRLLLTISLLLAGIFVATKIKFFLVEPVYRSSPLGVVDAVFTFFLFGVAVIKFLTNTKKPKTAISKFPNNRNIIFVLVLCIFSVLFVSGIFALNKESLDWDSVALYDARARFLQEGLNFSNMNSLSTYDNLNKYYYSLYPPFTSILHFFWYDLGIKLPVTFMYFTILILLSASVFLFGRQYVGTIGSLIITFLVAANKDIFSISIIEYTNLPFTLYLVSGLFALVLYLKDKDSLSLLLGTALIGSSVWIRYLEPVWFCVLVAFSITLLRRNRTKASFLAVLTLVTYSLIEYLSWSFFQNSIAKSPQIFFITPQVILEALLGIFTGALASVSIFFTFSFGLIVASHVLALLKINKNERYEFTFFKLVIFLSLGFYLVGSYILSMLFGWWREMAGSLVRSASFLVPISAFLVINNMKYILENRISLGKARAWFNDKQKNNRKRK